MSDPDQVRSYVRAYEWGGPTSALQLHHLDQLSRLIRPGDTVLDLACGPGPLLLELASIYPDVQFIGADLSPTMLEHLTHESQRRGLPNISVLLEDVRTLPSLKYRDVDLLISTSAFHHLPDNASLGQVFERTRTLLAPDGAFYFFDFGLLKSPKARQLFVAEVAKLAPPITVRDYDLSLQAAFPIDQVLAAASEYLPRPYVASRSAFVNFFYFLQSPPRIRRSETARGYISRIWTTLPTNIRAEHLMLRWFRTRSHISA